MKKMVFIILGTGILAFLLFGLYKASQLRNIEIIESITINANRQKVFDMVRYFENYPKWSPLLFEDPNLKYEVRGKDGTVGVQYHWEGSKGNEVGYQEIYKIENLEFVGVKCYIQKPFVAQPICDYIFSENEKGVMVNQVFKLESGWIDAFFMWIFGAKKEIEKTSRQELELLKKVSEK